MALIVRGLLGSFSQVALFALLLLVPAGTWHWPRAVLFLAVHGILLVVATVGLARRAPASLEARLQAPVHKSQPGADKIASAGLFLTLFAWFAFIAVDVFHLRWLSPPSLWVSIVGAMLYLLGFWVILLAIYQNAYAVPIVRDQSDRGHVLVDSGPYGRIRHPMYFGMLLFLAGIALWLESYASVLVLPVPLGFLLARIFIEEQTLRQTLPGYIEYMNRVRYRLIPYVW
jgi:protein-S-isoprenylcysteine O-methyltransferase Ste14